MATNKKAFATEMLELAEELNGYLADITDHAYSYTDDDSGRGEREDAWECLGQAFDDASAVWERLAKLGSKFD